MATMREYIDIIEQQILNLEKELSEYFYFDDNIHKDKRGKKKVPGSKSDSPYDAPSKDILGMRPTKGIAKYGDEFKAMKKGKVGYPPYPLGAPKGKLPEKRDR